MSQQETKDMAKCFYRASASEFLKIPGSPIAYWAKKHEIQAFSNGFVGDDASVAIGMKTGDNEKFVRYWHEISVNKIGFSLDSVDSANLSEFSWFPYVKGGDYRKWFGNQELVLNWIDFGENLKRHKNKKGIQDSRIRPSNFDKYFYPGLSWSFITSGSFGVRLHDEGFFFDVAGSSLFAKGNLPIEYYAGFLNSSISDRFLELINPTLNMQIENIKSLPLPKQPDMDLVSDISRRVLKLKEMSKKDWDSSEMSWNFKSLPLAVKSLEKLSCAYNILRHEWQEFIQEFINLELENDKHIVELFDFPMEEGKSNSYGTVSCNLKYKYDEQNNAEERIQSDTICEAVSYSIGCMMGRYSLDKPGLVLASQGETQQDYFDQIQSPRFIPDDDAILPLTDQEWFADDATNRFREFVRVAWGDKHLKENLDFVAESLCLHAIKPKRGESALDTIRRYLSIQFYKDHLSTYKKRPIYWLFSSGKHKAFECLVYLHRYNEGTLARMRTEYVIPLSAKLNAYVEKLEQDKDASTSAAENKRLEKEIATLHKQQAELAEFDEKLRHYADQRIRLDLDDGVKVNYGKFGDLLAEVKAVTGEKPQ